MIDLNSLKNVGPKSQAKLTSSGIKTIADLLYYFPYRYLDFSHISPIKDLIINSAATVSGQVISFQNIYTRFKKNLQKAVISDNTGQLDIIWFNQPYLSQTIKVGQTVKLAGTISLYQNRPCLFTPFIGENKTGKIIPLYSTNNGLTSSWFQKTITLNFKTLISTITADPVPPSVLKKYSLPNLVEALNQIHFPSSPKLLESARLRLAIDEFLHIFKLSADKKRQHQLLTPPKIFSTSQIIDRKINHLINSLPFSLSPSQLSAWDEIKNDLLKSTPCQRLLCGDVGSGKTIIALIAAYFASLNQTQVLVLAPTEILAVQHFATFKKYLGDSNIHLLTSKNKSSPLKKNSIVIATHAAIYQKDVFKNLGLLIIDEQHKFGVLQRDFLKQTPTPPHTINLTATAIPRTLAQTALGHLAISYIDHLNRWQPVKTFLVPPHKTKNCFQWLNDHIIQTRQQAFIVCPFIDESESLTSVKAAKSEFENLKKLLPHLKIELIHGKTNTTTRNQIFSSFKKNQINILVTTPIIEVGIDYPNATVIVILSADRFGLAQLHQLRGRVGRGEQPGYCYLFSDNDNPKTLSRLNFLCTHFSGPELAEYDLKTRGPGEIFATLQHGFPSLRLASLSNTSLISLAQQIFKDINITNRVR